MRIGAYIFDWDGPEDWAERHVDLGYGAAYFPLDSASDPAEIDACVEAAARHGLVIAEVGAWNNPLARDPDERRRSFDYAVAQLRLADRIGARCCVNISGSMGEVWDGPHPDNLTESTYRQVVRSVQAIIDAARPEHTYYTLEPMPRMFPHSIDDLTRLIRDVDRERFGVHVDMCNMVNSIDLVYHTGDLVRAFFKQFGPLIRSVHAKDTVLDGGLTLRIGEAIPGQGLFDIDALLTACDALDPDLPVMAEHLTRAEEYRQATDHLKARARALGIQPRIGHL